MGEHFIFFFEEFLLITLIALNWCYNLAKICGSGTEAGQSINQPGQQSVARCVSCVLRPATWTLARPVDKSHDMFVSKSFGKLVLFNYCSRYRWLTNMPLTANELSALYARWAPTASNLPGTLWVEGQWAVDERVGGPFWVWVGVWVWWFKGKLTYPWWVLLTKVITWRMLNDKSHHPLTSIRALLLFKSSGRVWVVL